MSVCVCVCVCLESSKNTEENLSQPEEIPEESIAKFQIRSQEGGGGKCHSGVQDTALQKYDHGSRMLPREKSVLRILLLGFVMCPFSNTVKRVQRGKKTKTKEDFIK